MTTEVDVVMIGGGPAGENVAGRCTQGGLDVVLVERELLGGECSYWACIPSKALLRPGEALAEARRVPCAAQAVDGGPDAATAFTGQGVQKLVHSATVAIVDEVPLERLWHAVPSFPTVSEVWLRLLEAYGL